ncbi:MAG: ABC transporter ATP-binding protein [Acidobacteria bacterium]|nr:ABC transporter ATP-binding protein [Acidobacteriota bacterium]
MHIVWRYLFGQRWLIALSLALAGAGQVLALVDPLIFGKIVDEYVVHPGARGQAELTRGVFDLLALAVAVALASLLARTVSDYVTRLVTQRFGVQIFNDGLRHAMRLSFEEYEELRSGETLALLQKVRADTERFVTALVNVLFVSLVGVIFLVWFAITRHWALVPVFVVGVLVVGGLAGLLGQRIKALQRSIVRETARMAGAATESLRNIELVRSLGLGRQEMERLRAYTEQIFRLEMQKVRKARTLAFLQGSALGILKQSILFALLWLIFHRVLATGELIAMQFISVQTTEIRKVELRRQLGLVTQETQLFSGTIRDNLRFVAPQATDEEMLAALRGAAVHSLVGRSPLGLDTVLGEGGIRLSGGERQRLAIARALIREPRLLILDEATAALDSLTEEEIAGTLRDLSRRRERIVVTIAHRLSTIRHADTIHVLERGRIVESGTHDELVRARGLYYAMWRQQIGERERTGDPVAN